MTRRVETAIQSLERIGLASAFLLEEASKSQQRGLARAAFAINLDCRQALTALEEALGLDASELLRPLIQPIVHEILDDSLFLVGGIQPLLKAQA